MMNFKIRTQSLFRQLFTFASMCFFSSSFRWAVICNSINQAKIFGMACGRCGAARYEKEIINKEALNWKIYITNECSTQSQPNYYSFLRCLFFARFFFFGLALVHASLQLKYHKYQNKCTLWFPRRMRSLILVNACCWLSFNYWLFVINFVLFFLPVPLPSHRFEWVFHLPLHFQKKNHFNFHALRLLNHRLDFSVIHCNWFTARHECIILNNHNN